MTRPLIVNIPHTLGREEATRRLKGGLARASSAISIVKIEEETWSGDHLSFKLSGLGQMAFGTVEVSDADVRIEVVLPWLLQRLGEMVQGAIRSRAHRFFWKKSSWLIAPILQFFKKNCLRPRGLQHRLLDCHERSLRRP